MKRNIFIFTLFLTLFFLSPDTFGYMGGGVKVIIGGDDPSQGFVLRLKAELESAGFLVEIQKVDLKGDPRRELDVAARKIGAGAAVLLNKAMGFVEIWITDRVTGKIVIRKVKIPEDEQFPDTFIALSSVELLRASFLEVATSSISHGSVKADAAVKKLVSPKSDEPVSGVVENDFKEKVFIQLAPSILIANFKHAPFVNAQTSIDCRVYKGLSLSLSGRLPMSTVKIKSQEGSAKVRAGDLYAGAGYISHGKKNIINGGFSAGWMLLVYKITGTPFEDYSGHETTFTTSSPYLKGFASLSFTKKVRVRLSILSGYSFTDLKVKIGENVNTFGKFYLSTSLGIVFVY
ncbi:MAG: hypothetical protein JXR91_04770 [Deltaproteobacteria bacterium]|nr:hypothetical protein [Deltaproteobacteria bacterium]